MPVRNEKYLDSSNQEKGIVLIKGNETDRKIQSQEDDTPEVDVCPIPVEKLIALEVALNAGDVKILKDDECSKNIVSQHLVEGNENILKLEDQMVRIGHSEKKCDQAANKIMLDAIIEIGYPEYVSNWVVGNCRYHALMGFPWHVQNNGRTNYDMGLIRFCGDETMAWNEAEASSRTKLSNIGVNSFPKLV